MKPAETQPCSACPWRRANQGTPHPHGWYTKKNLNRLWAGLRTGEAPGMSCHPTDPSNEVPDGGRWKAAPEDNEGTECAGALLLIQRELRDGKDDPQDYLRRRRHAGLTKTGFAFWALHRSAFAGTFLGGKAMTMVADTDEVGFDRLDQAETPNPKEET